ncbi:hypothetical protein AVEN_1475-1 [Araneus ventricosus]|uniref:Uncharacterized protein n=1 Tax=Araneus ventricosus TaxID=182803 RepID=A0A4Y2M2K2_ARAVE|nr:hypothetical protein AVEN_1475-1 [Araneus ventricosus]
MEDKRIKRKMVKTDADADHDQSIELLELYTMSSSLYTDTDVITLEYQSQNLVDIATLERECDRCRISDRTAASFSSAVSQDIGIVNERKASHVVDRNKILRQRKKL